MKAVKKGTKMPELDFYCSWEDSTEILQNLIDTKLFTFYFKKFYKEPIPISFKNLNMDIAGQLEISPSVYIWSDKNSIFPPQFRQFTDGDYDIDLTRSGPAMSFKLVRIHNYKERTQLGYGWVLLPPKQINPSTGEYYTRSKEFMLDFELVKKIVRKCTTRMYFSIEKEPVDGENKNIMDSILVGKRGVDAIKSKDVFIHIYGKWLGRNDLYDRRQDVKK